MGLLTPPTQNSSGMPDAAVGLTVKDIERLMVYGDTRLPIELAQVLHDKPHFSLGTVARFIRGDKSIVQCRYVKFGQTIPAASQLRVVGQLASSGVPYTCAATPADSHPGMIHGVLLFDDKIPAGNYGWAQMDGVLQAYGSHDAFTMGQTLYWKDDGTITPDREDGVGVVGVAMDGTYIFVAPWFGQPTESVPPFLIADITDLPGIIEELQDGLLLQGLLPKGPWEDSPTDYVVRDCVSYDGETYACIQDNSGVEPTVTVGWEDYWMLVAERGIQGDAGAPYFYVGYADDDDGTGFTMTFNPAKKWIAIINSVEVMTPVQADFDGLWRKYIGEDGAQGIQGIQGIQGDPGDDGDDGADGTNAYLYIGYASDDDGTDFTLTFDPDLDYIAIRRTTVAIPSPIVTDFTGLWKNYKGATGATGAAGSNGSNGTNGATWTSGAIDPSGGANGDFYLQTGTGATGVAGDIWKKTAGTWAILLNVIGAQGPQGIPGNDGADGADGTGDMDSSVYDALGVAEQLVGETAAQTLTNKTLDAPVITGVAIVPNQSQGDNSTKPANTAYVDAAVAAIIAASDAMVFKGVIDASANPNYPAADRGDTYRISLAGKIGGGSGVNVEVGDLILCLTDSTASGNQATVGTAWSIIQTNLDGAVIGPASVTDGVPVLFDGTTGKLIKATTFSAFKTALTLVASDVGLGNVTNDQQVKEATLTTRGDIFYRNATVVARLAKGTQYQVLQAGANDPAYDAVHLDQAAAVTGVLPAANLPDTSTSAEGVVELATAAEYRTGTDSTRALSVAEVWAAALAATLTDGANIAVDLAAGINWGGSTTTKLSLGGNRTLSAPSNAKGGQCGILWFGASSSTRTLTLNGSWVLCTGVEAGPYSITTSQILGVAYACLGTTVYVTAIIRQG